MKQDSYLVQRLREPMGTSLMENAIAAFSFGGGLHNGGLSTQAMDLLRGIFSFDYMGSAEFEWGAVPDALRQIASASLTTFTMTIPLSAVASDWRDKKKAAPASEAIIYVICAPDDAGEVESRIRGWAAEPYNGGLKETTQLSSTLRPRDDYDTRVRGWLELDNGFFFFTSEQMWAATCQLFGVKATVSS